MADDKRSFERKSTVGIGQLISVSQYSPSFHTLPTRVKAHRPSHVCLWGGGGGLRQVALTATDMKPTLAETKRR